MIAFFTTLRNLVAAIRRGWVDPQFRALTFLVVVLLAVWSAVALAAENPTSKNDGRLASWLEKHPSADANKDGVLDGEDVKEWWKRLKKLLTYKLPSAGGFSLGFLYGVSC